MKIKDKIVSKIPEKARPKLKRGLNIARIIKNVVCWTLIAVLSVIVLIFLITRINGGTPSVFGYTIHRVESGSMEPELHVGDVILNQDVDDVTALEVGDIITFQGGAEFEYHHVTHRLIVEPYINGGSYELQTKGDANDIPDSPIKEQAVESKLVRKLDILATLYELFLSPWGLILFIALLLLIFFDEIVNIVRILSGNYPDEDEESISDIIKRIQKEELEKELAEQKNREQLTEKSDAKESGE